MGILPIVGEHIEANKHTNKTHKSTLPAPKIYQGCSIFERPFAISQCKVDYRFSSACSPWGHTSVAWLHNSFVRVDVGASMSLWELCIRSWCQKLTFDSEDFRSDEVSIERISAVACCFASVFFCLLHIISFLLSKKKLMVVFMVLALLNSAAVLTLYARLRQRGYENVMIDKPSEQWEFGLGYFLSVTASTNELLSLLWTLPILFPAAKNHLLNDNYNKEIGSPPTYSSVA